MKSKDWSQVGEIVDTVSELPEQERESALVEACGGDARLETEVRELLSAMQACPPDFLPLGEPSHILMPAKVLRAGRTIGKFRLLREIGSGGTSVVFAAEQLDLTRRVALKLVPTTLLDPVQLSRIQREARLMSSLDHKGIVTVYEQGSHGDFHWIAMELVDGHDLREELETIWDAGSPDSKGVLPPRASRDFLAAAARLIRDSARALHVAHDSGIYHRDIKPGNILLAQPDGRPRLVDFGLAHDAREPAQTETGTVMGTPLYMSPEQTRGKFAKARSEVYSLGAVMFHLATGRAPFLGRQSLEVIERIQMGPMPTIRQINPQLSPELSAICGKAMDVDPAHRYESAAALADDLDLYLDSKPVAAVRPSARRRAKLWLARNRQSVAVAAGVVVALGLAAWGSVAVHAYSTHDEQEDSLRQQLVGIGARVQTSKSQSDPRGMVRAAATLASLRSQLDEHDSLGPAARQIADELTTEARTIEASASRTLEPSLAAGDPTVLRALQQLEHAAAILPGDAELQAKARFDYWFPTISLRTDPPGAMVTLQPAAVIAGDFQPAVPLQERTDLRDVAVAPGYYRILIVQGTRFAELSRYFGEWKRHYNLGTIKLHEFDAVTADMVRFEAGQQTVRLPLYENKTAKTLTAKFQAFYLDRTEVSNAEYLEFVTAKQGDEQLIPTGWRQEPDNPAWRERPMAYLSWRQARAYAEWRGKRLPTELEWSQAALGWPQRAYPWGDDERLAASIPTSKQPIVKGVTPGDVIYQEYLRVTLPVGTLTADATAEGILHLAGNVSEWTDSTALGAIDGSLFPIPTRRRSKGWSWMDRGSVRLLSYQEVQIEASFSTPNRGFRCAKSAFPKRK